MNLHLGFSWVGLAVFLLPLAVNVLYGLLPPRGEAREERKYPLLEGVEQGSRVLYAAALCLLVSGEPLDYASPLFFLGLAFLVLYHVVWIRYFAGGREVKALGTPFLFVPMPLAVFPVLYFFFAALWMHNLVAAGLMVLFGIAHNVVSYRNLRPRD